MIQAGVQPDPGSQIRIQKVVDPGSASRSTRRSTGSKPVAHTPP